MARSIFNTSDDFQTAASLGLIEGVSGVADFAQEGDLSAGAPVILGTSSPVLLLPPDAGETVEVVSGAAGNAGAEIVLEVLDANFERVDTVVSLSGAGVFPVLDPETGLPLVVTRVNNAFNVGPRGVGELVDDVEVRSVATPANVYGKVGVEAQAMQQAIRTIPAGCTAMVKALTASMKKSGGADTDVSFGLFASAVGTVFRQVFSFGLQRSGDTSLEFVEYAIESFEGPVDLYLVAESSANGAAVSARLAVELVKR